MDLSPWWSIRTYSKLDFVSLVVKNGVEVSNESVPQDVHILAVAHVGYCNYASVPQRVRQEIAVGLNHIVSVGKFERY